MCFSLHGAVTQFLWESVPWHWKCGQSWKKTEIFLRNIYWIKESQRLLGSDYIWQIKLRIHVKDLTSTWCPTVHGMSFFFFLSFHSISLRTKVYEKCSDTLLHLSYVLPLNNSGETTQLWKLDPVHTRII